jgi:hypothetical protein
VRLRHVLGACSLALLATSCSLSDNSDSGSINIYVGVDKSTLPVGESMTITVTARNVGYAPLTLSGPSDCLLFLEILNTTGLVIWRSNVACAPNTVTETIEPGENKVQSFAWTGVNEAGARLASGIYHIRGIARLTSSAYAGPLLSVSVE